MLGDVSHVDAMARPMASAHSIWELVHHLAAWTAIVQARLAPTPPTPPTTEQDWPPVRETSAEAWRTAVQALKDAHRDLAAEVAELSDDALDKRVQGKDHTVSAMLHGLVEHDAYHGGQIAILKRALTK
ncbi:MAG TPA: DinB family protein [Gemmatimonadaceae bacterium]